MVAGSKNKITIITVIMLVLALSLYLFISRNTLEKKVLNKASFEIKVAHANSQGDPSYAAWEYFKERIEERSKGEVSVAIFANGKAGDERELIDAVKFGQLDLVTVNIAPLAQVYKKFNILVLPYLWQDEATVFQFCESEYGKKLADEFQFKTGMHLLSLWSNGTRHTFQIAKPIFAPKDFKGITVRIMNNEVYRYLFSALGAKAIPLPFGEVNKALTNGIIDVADNDVAGYISMKFYEPAKYFSLTGHVIATKPLLASNQFIARVDSLPNHLKTIVYDVIEETKEWQRAEYVKSTEEYFAWMKDNGMHINTVKNRDAFRKIAEDKVWIHYHDAIGKELFNTAINFKKK